VAAPKAGLGYQVQVYGLERWTKDLTTTRAAIPHFVVDANRKVGEIVKQETINRMNRQFKLPRAERTGALERSVFVSKDPVLTPTTQGIFVGIGRVGEGVPYAGWWEYGYEGGAGHPPPFRLYAPHGRTLYPGIRRRWPEIRAIYEVVARRLGNRMMQGKGA
jgi:hypothetical protein